MKNQNQINVTVSGVRKALRKLSKDGKVKRVPGVNPATGRTVWLYELVEKDS
jgi:predicted ArsR family transcriptional regulator